MKNKLTLILIALIFFIQCKKEEDEGMPQPAFNCENLATIKILFEEESQHNNFIKEVQAENDQYVFLFEDQSEYKFDENCFEQVLINEEDWVVNLVLPDSTQLQPRYLGKLDIHEKINPYSSAPLYTKLVITTPVPGKVGFKLRGRQGSSSNISLTGNTFATTNCLEVLGLYPDHKNIIDIYFLDEAGNQRTSDTIHIQTAPVPHELPLIDIDVRVADKMEPGMNFISYRGLVQNPNIPFIMDSFGDIRWYLDFTDHPELSDLGYDVGIERLENGNFYFGDWSSHAIYEVTVYGEVLSVWPFEGYYFHHNVIEKPDGNFLVSVSKEGSTHQNGNTTIEDYIIEIDRSSGAIIQEWDLKESLDEQRMVLADIYGGDFEDWIHVNAIVYDESDNTIILSGRTQGVVKLDYSNNVQWILSSHKGWGENRRGEDLNNFLLQPLDANEALIVNNAVLQGSENHADFEWNWQQHAPLLLPNGNLMLFDNGSRRNFEENLQYSRAVEYKIDPVARTVQQVWQYGKERGSQTFSPIVSDVDFHPDKNTILFAPGAFVENGAGFYGGKIIEVDYDTKEVVFEARLSNLGITFHRVERMPLYPD